MPRTIKPVTRQQWIVTIKGIDCYWETCSGLEETAQTSEYSDGLSNRLYKLQGPRSISDITFTKAFDPVADQPIVNYWKTYCQGEADPVTASVTPIKYCPTPEPIGSSLILYGVMPITLRGFEVDKKSTDISTLELVISVEEWTYA
jgi:hypothetical protein